MAATIRINEQQADEIRALLANVRNGAENAMRTAINRTVDGAVTLIAKQIGQTVTLKASLIKSKITKIRATNYALGGAVQIKSNRIPLAAYSTNPSAANSQQFRNRNGVSVKVFKNRAPVVFRSAFFAVMPGGHIGVFERSGSPRLPIHELVGPMLPNIYENTPGLAREVEQTSADRLLRELDSQTNYLLGLGNG